MIHPERRLDFLRLPAEKLLVQFPRFVPLLLLILSNFLTGCGTKQADAAAQAQAEQELASLREANQELQRLQAENQTLPRLRKDNEELHRLREQTQDLAKLRQDQQDLRGQLQALHAPKPRP